VRPTSSVLAEKKTGGLYRRASVCRFRGGAGRDRTDDLKLAKLALSQLSYNPTSTADEHSDGVVGLEGETALPAAVFDPRPAPWT
jgi:hypothetical protein